MKKKCVLFAPPCIRMHGQLNVKKIHYPYPHVDEVEFWNTQLSSSPSTLFPLNRFPIVRRYKLRVTDLKHQVLVAVIMWAQGVTCGVLDGSTNW